MTKAKSGYRYGVVPSITFTDGAKYVADAAGAYWLLDEIALAQRHVKAVAAEEFQVWKLNVNADDTATLVCEDGNDNAVFTKPIAVWPNTDIRLPVFRARVERADPRSRLGRYRPKGAADKNRALKERRHGKTR